MRYFQITKRQYNDAIAKEEKQLFGDDGET